MSSVLKLTLMLTSLALLGCKSETVDKQKSSAKDSQSLSGNVDHVKSDLKQICAKLTGTPPPCTDKNDKFLGTIYGEAKFATGDFNPPKYCVATYKSGVQADLIEMTVFSVNDFNAIEQSSKQKGLISLRGEQKAGMRSGAIVPLSFPGKCDPCTEVGATTNLDGRGGTGVVINTSGFVYFDKVPEKSGDSLIVGIDLNGSRWNDDYTDANIPTHIKGCFRVNNLVLE